MKLASYVAMLSLSTISCAFAEEPQAPATQPGVVQSTAPAPAPAATVKGAPTAAQIKLMRSRGYKPLTRNGTMVFCRSESELGTHFERTHCNTLEELNHAELNGKDYVNSLQQQGSPVPFKGP